jgi:hypothetical protein
MVRPQRARDHPTEILISLRIQNSDTPSFSRQFFQTIQRSNREWKVLSPTCRSMRIKNNPWKICRIALDNSMNLIDTETAMMHSAQYATTRAGASKL